MNDILNNNYLNPDINNNNKGNNNKNYLSNAHTNPGHNDSLWDSTNKVIDKTLQERTTLKIVANNYDDYNYDDYSVGADDYKDQYIQPTTYKPFLIDFRIVDVFKFYRIV